MIQFAPHVLGVAGCMLLMNAAITKANDAIAFIVVKIAVPLIGTASIWMSAIMLVGGPV